MWAPYWSLCVNTHASTEGQGRGSTHTCWGDKKNGLWFSAWHRCRCHSPSKFLFVWIWFLIPGLHFGLVTCALMILKGVPTELAVRAGFSILPWQKLHACWTWNLDLTGLCKLEKFCFYQILEGIQWHVHVLPGKPRFSWKLCHSCHLTGHQTHLTTLPPERQFVLRSKVQEPVCCQESPKFPNFFGHCCI